MTEDIEIKQVEVVPYDPNWPNAFASEALFLKQALGPNYVEVHHIGSTAVPGLAAKPKIDIIAVVKNGEATIKPLEQAGYTYHGEWNIPFKYGFTKRSPARINLHVFEEGNPEIELNLLIRDHLRNSPTTRAQYAKLKTQLLMDENSFIKEKSKLFTGYNLGKDRFIRELLRSLEFKRHRLLKVTHFAEWEEYYRIKGEQVPATQADNHHHFILCVGVEIVAAAHIEFLSEGEAVLGSLAVDEPFQNKGYNTEMVELLKKWLKKHGRSLLE